MANISFYPGPSRVFSNITKYIYEAYKDGYMSVNHRSDRFMDLYRKTREVLQSKLHVPEDYAIVFTSSATECWEIIAQSLVREVSRHFYNGAFGERWQAYGRSIHPQSVGLPFGVNEALPFTEVDGNAEVLCLVHTETSNGTFLNKQTVKAVWERKSAGQLIAFDATSSIGGVDLPWQHGDIWFASVQKCLGLPAGLGVMMLSPQAVNRAREIGDTSRYNSLLRILEHAENNQTHFTPNILGIYLLMRTQDFSKGITAVEQKVLRRFACWTSFLQGFEAFEWLVKDESLRAKTVFTVATEHPDMLLKQASESGFVLGNGYGIWKNNTFRIANFPAIKKKEIEALQHFFRKRLS